MPVRQCRCCVGVFLRWALEQEGVATPDQLRPRHAIAQILFSEKVARDRSLADRFKRAYLRSVRYYYGALKDGRLAGPNAEEIISVLNEYTAIKDPQIFRTILGD